MAVRYGTLHFSAISTVRLNGTYLLLRYWYGTLVRVIYMRIKRTLRTVPCGTVRNLVL